MAFLPTQPFQWGSAGQALTPEQVAERQRAAQSMMQAGSDYSPVGHWSQGLARLAQGLIGGYQARQANEAEQAGVASANEAMSPIIAALGGGSMPSMPMASGGTPASVPTGDMAAAIREGLISRGLPDHVADGFVMNFQDESGLNPGINEAAPVVPGSRGGFGLAQWTGPRRVALERFADQRGTAVSDLNTQLDYLMTELAGPEAAAASQIMGAQDTGSAAAAIVNAFLRPAEEHRARRVAEYTGGAPTAYSGVQQPQSGVVSALLAANANPWARQQYGGVIDALLGSEIQRQQQASDPLRQIQLQQEQIRLNQMMNPQPAAPVFEGGQWWNVNGGTPQALTERPAPEMTEGARTLQWRAEQSGLQPGTQEYADFMARGGRAESAEPESIRALRIRAQEAGLQPGSPEYNQFMVSGGSQQGLAIDVDPATGAISFRQGAGAGAAKPFTEGQSKDNVYATRAEGALAVLDPIATELSSRTGRAAEAVPFGLARGLQSDDFQVAKTSGDEFLQAILRKDTGAAITADEQVLYGTTYLPQPGDGEAQLAYKQQARRRAIEALKSGMTPSQMLAVERGLQQSGSQALPPPAPAQAPAATQTPTRPEMGGLKRGYIESGWRYVGGPPSQAESWEQVR